VKTKLLIGARGKGPINQLHRLLKGYLARKGHENANMIGHNHKLVNSNFSCPRMASKNFNEKLRHAIRLEERSTACCSRSYKERARAK
jgi:hypothetical protein